MWLQLAEGPLEDGGDSDIAVAWWHANKAGVRRAEGYAVASASPPLTITREQVDEAAERLEEALKQL